MFFITLASGESIRIGDDIVVTVSKIKPNKLAARLAVDAPREVLILRGELEAGDRGPAPANSGRESSTNAGASEDGNTP